MVPGESRAELGLGSGARPRGAPLSKPPPSSDSTSSIQTRPVDAELLKMNGHNGGNSYTHTKALLGYLLAAYPKARQNSTGSRASAPSSLLLSVQSLDLESSPSTRDAHDGDASAGSETDEEGDRRSTSTATSSAASSTEVPTDDEQCVFFLYVPNSACRMQSELEELTGYQPRPVRRMSSVIDLLEDDSVDEEDKPDALKTFLSSILVTGDHVRLLTGHAASRSCA